MPNDALLTATERKALDMSAALAELVHKIIGHGPQSKNDWNEAAQHIHSIQHLILSQAAARAYPEDYRLLGENL